MRLERNHFGLVARANRDGHPIWLLEPQTFMNRSGQAVASLSRFFKIPASAILIAHDELDLPPGECKLKFSGGHAGHNGLRDIHAQLGTSDYWRLRIGIGHPGNKTEVVNWVLKKPPLDQRIAIDQALDRCTQAVADLAAGQMDQAMVRIHTSKPPRPKPPRQLAADSPDGRRTSSPPAPPFDGAERSGSEDSAVTP
jgi:PTH1 family peptidyl-tRNA hydrolase